MVKNGREVLYGNTVMERLGLSNISTWEIAVSIAVLVLSVIGECCYLQLKFSGLIYWRMEKGQSLRK